MTTCLVLPMGPVCIDLTGIRANDRNMAAFHSVTGATDIDLTGLTLSAMARLHAQDQGAPALTAVVNITNAAQGRYTVAWPGADVATLLLNGVGPILKTWKGVWDIQADNGVDDPQTLIFGKIACEWDVTR